MKFVMERGVALAALARVDSVIPAKATIPILAHVAIEAHADGMVTFRGNNLDMQATVHAAALVAEAGETTVDSERLLSMVKNSAEGAEIAFELLDTPDRLNVKSGRSKFNFPTESVDKYPSFGDDEWPHTFEPDPLSLSEMMERTRFAAASPKNQAKAFLAGVHLDVHGDELHAFAADGYKLAFMRGDCPAGASLPPDGITIPPALLDEMVSLMAGRKDGVRFLASGSKVALITDSGSISGKLLGGKYLDYRSVLDRIAFAPTFAHTFTTGRETLISAVRRVASVGASKGVAGDRSVRFSIRQDGVADITARTQGGDGADMVQGETNGPGVQLKFNADWLLEVLGRVVGDKVVLNYSDGANDQIRFDSPDEPDTLFIIAPQRA